jgi:hypothetical protein
MLWVAACCGCAEMALPPGGPEDEIAPKLISVSPEDGATGVSPTTMIEARFSERIGKAEGAFEITPDPGEVKLSIHGDRVSAEASLEPDQTYTARFSTLLTDAHGVKLAEPTEWAFSTGARIDAGRLSGNVSSGLASGDPVEGALVVLLPLAMGEEAEAGELLDEKPLHWIQPRYHRRTDADGAWSMEHLPDGRWRVLAVDDANGNGRVEPGRERHAAYWRPVATDDSTRIELIMVEPQVRPMEIADARMPHRGLLDLRPDRRLPQDTDLQLQILPAGKVKEVIVAGRHLFAYVDSLADGLLEVSVEGLPDGLPRRTEVPSIPFRVVRSDDQRAPRLAAATLDSTGGDVPLSGRVFLSFDEPLAQPPHGRGGDEPQAGGESGGREGPGDAGLILLLPADSTQGPVAPLAAELISPALLVARFALPESASVAGMIVPATDRLADAAGNAAEFELPARLPARNTAASLAGVVSGWPQLAGERRLAVSRGGRIVVDLPCGADGSFSVPLAPAGKLVLAAYVDRDGDHLWRGADPRTGLAGEPATTIQVELEAGATVTDLTIGFQ